MSKTVSLKDKYPNEAKFVPGEARELNEDNHYKELEIEYIRKAYVKFTVFMEALYDTLELNRSASLEEFGIRIRDLCLAAAQGEKEEVDKM